MLKFLRTTITGGILFMIPMVLIGMVLLKAHQILVKISAPIAHRLPEGIWGFDMKQLLAVVILVLICFISGLLFRSALIKRWVGKLEDNVLSFIPGYSMMKAILTDKVSVDAQTIYQSVLVQDGEAWKLGLLMEEDADYCTVFFPDPPKHDSGELKIVPQHSVKKINLPISKFTQIIKAYGKGTIAFLKNS